ncbi:MAG: MaoC family dehydratase [Granulosicoccaceae bacterium]
MTTYTPEQLLNTHELQLAPSDWIELSQDMINAFADVTRDHQFIHIDPERARLETPFGGTIAHGFFTLSLLSSFAEQCFPHVEGEIETLNYGIDKLRFLNPVPSGSKIRAHFKLQDCHLKKQGRLLIRYKVNVEIEGLEQPALVTDWLAMVLFSVD